MTREQFNDYPFSIKTVFTINGSKDVISVLSVDFVNRTINNIPIVAINLVYQAY